MATQTPRRDNLHGEEDATPRFTSEHSSLRYDDQTTPAGKSSDPRGDDGTPARNQAVAAGNPSDPRGDSLNRGDIARKEAEAGIGSSTAIGDGEKSLSARAAGGLYRQEDTPKRTRLRGRLSKFTRKRIAVMATTGLIAGGGIFSLSLIQGPMQLIHLSQILQRPSFNNEKVVQSRLNGLIRFNQTRDPGETRVGKVGSKIFRDATNDLRNAGIEFDRNPKTGSPRSMTIDISKHPEFKGMSESQARNAIARKYGIPSDQWTRIGTGSDVNGHKFALNTRDFGAKALLGISKTSLTSLENGKILTGMQYRAIAKFFNAPIYGGVKRAAAEKDNKAATKAERREREKERQKKLQPAKSEKFGAAKGKLRDSLNKNSGKLSVGLVGVETVCLMRTVAEVVPIVNRDEVVKPTVAKAENIKSIGAQEQSGQNITLDDAGDVTQSLTDENGQSVWLGMALQAISGKSQLSGIDIDDAYRQAFSVATTATNIMGTVGNVPGAEIACSEGGQIAQGVINVGLLITGPGGWATKALQGGLGMAATSAALQMLQANYGKLIADEAVVPDLLSGPQGGNLMAYGAREAANITARSSGGVPLTPAEQLAYENDQKLEEEADFRSKGFFGRVFDVKDHRTLAASLIQNSSTDLSVNAGKLMGASTNGGAILSSLTSTLTPPVKAAGEGYWGEDFPLYGIPEDLLIKYEDPYENDAQANALLDGGEGDSLRDRAKKCFGVAIEKGSEGWDVTPAEDVNPNDNDYASGNCGERSENWDRMKIFTLDTRIINLVDCWDGNDEVCEKAGIDQSSSEGSSAPNEALGDANMRETVTVKTPGKFITLPKKYSCEGRSTRIDSRIAPALAYMLTKYNMCADDGLANGHLSHGAGLGVDIRPKGNNNSKQVWKDTVEAAARDMGWTGDSADEGKKGGCASYSSYGQCVGGSGNIPQWVRWIGYNGDVDHGDPWHVFGGSYAHIHIGWASPNGGDATAPSIISQPIPAVYTFPAPMPDDLKGLID